MNLVENISFDELILREGIDPPKFSNILDLMEALENIEMVSHLGDRVLSLMRQAELAPERGEALLSDLLDAVRNPIEATARVAEIRRELKEHGK